MTIVIVREDLLDRAPKNIPSVFHYKHMAAHGSLLNTPPVFAIYAIALTLKWIKAQGGLAEMERRATERSTMLYDAIDASLLFTAPVAKADRSRMNVVFDSGNPAIDVEFVKFCEARGLISLRGHRFVAACGRRFTTPCRSKVSRSWCLSCENLRQHDRTDPPHRPSGSA